MKFYRGLLIYVLCCFYTLPLIAQIDSVSLIDRIDSLKLAADTSVKVVQPPATKDTGIVYVAGLSIYGNKKTRSYIIEREIPFKQGDYMHASELNKQIVVAKQQLINTSLFLEVNVYVENRFGEMVFVVVYVKERWYVFPLPYFKLIDRNLNTWWDTYNHDFNRVNYGIKLLHNNFTGQRDKINLYLITGYTRQVAFRYLRPFADKSLTKGFNVYFNYTKQRELNYGTNLSTQKFYKDTLSSDFMRTAIRGQVDYVYRPHLRTYHTFSLSYASEKVDDTILKLNENYFPDGKTKISYPELAYTLVYNNADYLAYPTNGFIGQFSLSHRGFQKSFDMTQVQAILSYTKPILPNTQIRFQYGGTLRVPFNQPFYNKNLFGYGSIFMRGLEYYVIDGVAGSVGRVTLQNRLFQFTVNAPYKKDKLLKLPFRFYGKIYGDAGYAYDKHPGNSLLNNKFLYSYGFGVDMVAVYDLVFKFDYSFNQLGESGFFVHVRTDF